MGSLKQKFRDNLAAIELLHCLNDDERPATDEEKQVLVRYVGWGGIPQVFAQGETSEWAEERQLLKEALSQEEYKAARASTLNAHYTSPDVIQAIYQAVKRFGFKGGRILEPALGTGHFFGLLPKNFSEQSRLTGIELDSVTAGIARKLYPDADIRQQGFEKAVLVDGAYDLAISNVPFGDYKVFDPKFNGRYLIHDYFFAKATDKVREGGIIAFITSKGTLDKTGRELRSYMSDKVDFLGAIRLPNTAFKTNANTEVTTDIVFLRRLPSGERPTGPQWLYTEEHQNDAGERFWINEYFVRHPEMMLGRMAYTGSMYGRNEPTLEAGEDKISVALGRAIQRLPSNIYQAITLRNQQDESAKEDVLAPSYLKEGAYTLHEGEIMIRSGEALAPVSNLSKEAVRRVRELIKVRDSVREVLRTQLSEESEAEIAAARLRLNRAYEQFVQKFGPINLTANRRAFRGDPDLPLLCSLEDYDDETKKAQKAAIFRERTIQPAKAAETVDLAQDALVLSLNEKGKVDLEYIEALLRRPPDEFLPELKGLIFRNPQTDQWETEDQYLSGNVREKLLNARSAAAHDGDFQENVDALESVQPTELMPSEIDARLGSVWVPASDVQDFTRHLLNESDVQVSHSVALGTWYIKAGYFAKGAISNTVEWGTSHYSAVSLIQDALNLKIPTVYDKEPHTENRVVNIQETEAARDRLEKIKERFKEWIWESDERAERLGRVYNEQFNSTRLRVYNGDHLTLPSSSQQVTLRAHQRNGVWRIIQSDNTLLAHVVGAGKTYTMVAAGIELKRLGLASKPMFVVPNHMLAQFSNELLALYPTANILAAGKSDFEATKRANLFSRIATGTWDAVIVTHASFEKIPVAEETRRRFIEDQIYDVERAIREQAGDGGTRVVKELERVKKRLTTKLEELSGTTRKDNTLTFEELGVDRLFVDEAHKFKNLFYVTKMNRVAGLPQTASERAFDMFLKVRHIQGKNNGGGVVFATGTPISNTMAEMYTMQRYLQMMTLEGAGLQHFDSWAGTFGEAVSAMELSPSGSGYRLQTRFARFVNVPELMQQFRQVADVQTAESLKLPIPRLEHGRPLTISAPSTPRLKAFVESLVERTEAIKNGSVDPSEDNMLKVTTEGRKAALDLRLVYPSNRDEVDSKINLAVGKVFQIWGDSTAGKGAQMIFCDLSAPSSEGFSVYNDLRTKLESQGVPPEQIAFIQDYDEDAAKASLFRNVREGKVRILIGSTLKMGEGTNVQKRLIALHHLDAPWRPADIEQREGRILRQGNENEEVKIFRYVTEGSFDAYMWQTLENKCRFIAQVMTGDATVRKAEDVDSAALTYAEVKAIASGNPLVIEKASVDAEVMRLTRLKRQYTDSQFKIRYRIRGLQESIALCERSISNLEADVKTRTSTRTDNFCMNIKGQTFHKRSDAGEVLVKLASSLHSTQPVSSIGEIAGFSISLQRSDEQISVVIHGKAKYTARVSESPLGTIASLEYAVEGISKELEERNTDLKHYCRQIAELQRQLNQSFAHEEKLAVALERQQKIIDSLDITKSQQIGVDELTVDSSEQVRPKRESVSVQKPRKLRI